MNKLKEMFNKLLEKYKGFSKGVRIAIVVAIIALLIAIASLFFYNSANKYKVLFSNLDPTDAQLIMAQLTDLGVDMKVEGETILVPRKKVDQLRLELAPNLSGGSDGYELLDNSGSFGMTEDEFNLKKLRAHQGELEKTIKSFPQVETVRVHITPAKDSVFVEDKEPGKAAVYIKLAAGNNLTKDQVKSIVALVSASSSNIPEENVQVIDNNMNLLTEGLDTEDGIEVSSEAIQGLFDLEKKYEKELEDSIVKLLEPVIGKNKVTSSVNVDLDFDSKQKTETIIDPNKVIVSQQTIKEENTSSDKVNSGSPVDESMQNTIGENTEENSSSREEVTTNYETGRTEIQTISAPGEVKRLTATVFVDGNLDQNVQTAIENAVANAIGLNAERGDSISVTGMQFDALGREGNQAINELLEQERTKKLLIYAGLGIAALIALIIVIIIRVRKSRRNDEEEKENLLDVVIDDTTERTQEMPKLDLDIVSSKTHIENEIKKYATEKPEQVAEIIKSWLNENDR